MMLKLVVLVSQLVQVHRALFLAVLDGLILLVQLR